MSWAKRARKELKEGRNVVIKPKGHSMEPKVMNGATVTLKPITPDKVHRIKIGAVVLVRVKGRDYLHLVKARRGQQLLIGNNKGHTNGWVSPHALYGEAVVIDNGN